MIEKTRHSHTSYKMALPFVDQAEANGGAIRCQSSGFMDLTIEKLYYNDYYGSPVYSIVHYGRQNGDAMRDPEITFSVDRAAEKVIPLTFQNDYLGVYQEVIQERRGKMMYCVSLLKDLDEFFWQWLKNIEMQGFSPEQFEVID